MALFFNPIKNQGIITITVIPKQKFPNKFILFPTKRQLRRTLIEQLKRILFCNLFETECVVKTRPCHSHHNTCNNEETCFKDVLEILKRSLQKF